MDDTISGIDESSLLLAEYSTIREEKRYYRDRMDQALSFGCLFVLGLLGYGWNQPSASNGNVNPAIWTYFTAAIVVVLLAYYRLYMNLAFHKVNAYVEVFIERKLPELSWHRRCGQYFGTVSKFKYMYIIMSKMPTALYGILLFMSFNLAWNSGITTVWILAWGVIIVLFIVLLYLHRWYRYDRFLQEWTEMADIENCTVGSK